jgi:hypothetical protein
MDVVFSDDELTEHQVSIADRLERIIAGRAQYSRRAWPSNGNGPAINFAICTRAHDLSVVITVYQDSVQVHANCANVIIELIDLKDYAAWADGASAAVAALLQTPLRIRVRQTLVLRRQTGAIQLAYENQNLWNGDALSCLGVGTMLTFDDWFEPSAG